MKIEILLDSVKNPTELRDKIGRRLRKVFSRHKDELAEVEVSIRDVNGEKGGADKLCKIQLKRPGASPIVVSSLEVCVESALQRCVKKALYSFRRDKEKYALKKVPNRQTIRMQSA